MQAGLFDQKRKYWGRMSGELQSYWLVPLWGAPMFRWVISSARCSMNYFRKRSEFHGGVRWLGEKICKLVSNLEHICKLAEIEYKCPVGPAESENIFHRIKKMSQKKIPQYLNKKNKKKNNNNNLQFLRRDLIT